MMFYRTQCTQDYVQIYDGASLDSSRLLRYSGYAQGRICDRSDSRIRFFSRENIATVFYHTDGIKSLSDTSGLRVLFTLRGKNYRKLHIHQHV